jgi:hypothetical protein
MAVTLDELKAHADASKRDRACLQQLYEPLTVSATRGQRLSTVCRTSEETLRTQQYEPVVPNDRDAPPTGSYVSAELEPGDAKITQVLQQLSTVGPTSEEPDDQDAPPTGSDKMSQWFLPLHIGCPQKQQAQRFRLGFGIMENY